MATGIEEYVELPGEPAAQPPNPQGLRPNETPSPDPLPGRQLALELYRDSLADQEDFHRWQAEELDFVLKSDQWRKPKSRTSTDEDILPTGAELFHLQRHKWSKLASAPIYIECRPWPGQEIEGAEPAEQAKAIIESVVYDRRKRYRVKRRQMIIGGIAARSWVMAVDYDARADQRRGGAVFRTLPPWLFGVAPGWNDIHDPTCPFVWELCDMRVADVIAKRKDGWKVPDDLRGDPGTSGGPTRPGERSDSPSGSVRLSADADAQHRGTRGERVQVLKMWLRYSDDEVLSEPGESDEAQPIPGESQYMFCPVCGHTDDGEELRNPQTGELPEVGPDCPECGQEAMVAANRSSEVDPMESYPKGRLIICAVNQEIEFYDDAWPYRLRSFPYWYFKSYEHPIDLTGPSDTSLHWESQQLLNGTAYLMWEQMRRAVNLILAPWDGLVDYRKQPFRLTNEFAQMAYFTSPLGASGVQVLSTGRMPEALMPFHQLLADRLRQHTGTQDLSLSPTQIANATVGAVQAAERQGEVPLDDHLDALREDESVFLGVVLDLYIGCMSKPREISYRDPANKLKNATVSSATLQAFDVNVAASPSLAAVKAEEIQSFVQWASLPMHIRLAVAKMANIPLSYVRELEMAEAAMMGAGPTAPTGEGDPNATVPLPAGAGGPPTAGM